jgi:hypothetical protein
MPRNPQNADRRRHRRYMDLGVIDASLNSEWRRKLFAAPCHQEFPIDSEHTEGLPGAVASGIRRHALEYEVGRVPQSETSFDDPVWEGCVFFRFRARRYPDMVSFSANNREVL